jgi:hypothetical protein
LVASGLGAASSSCSYVAVALARSIFRKGGDFTAAEPVTVDELRIGDSPASKILPEQIEREVQEIVSRGLPSLDAARKRTSDAVDSPEELNRFGDGLSSRLITSQYSPISQQQSVNGTPATLQLWLDGDLVGDR